MVKTQTHTLFVKDLENWREELTLDELETMMSYIDLVETGQSNWYVNSTNVNCFYMLNRLLGVISIKNQFLGWPIEIDENEDTIRFGIENDEVKLVIQNK